jgi:hypothetical protein
MLAGALGIHTDEESEGLVGAGLGRGTHEIGNGAGSQPGSPRQGHSCCPQCRLQMLSSPLQRNPEVRGHWKLSYSQK